MSRSLAFLPGTMCDERLWAPVRLRLNQAFSTSYIAIETRQTREAMFALIDSAAASGGPLHLVAFSMGGYLALDYALSWPDRIASLVTVGSSAFGLTAGEAAERVRAIAMLEKHPYRGISRARLNQFVHPSHQSDPAVVGVIEEMDRDLGRDVLISQLRETSTRASLAPRLPELGMPALYIGADGDPFAPWASIEQMTALTPGARMIKASNAGHMLPLEQPDWLATQIAEYHSA